MSAYFITGATGVVGNEIASLLLSDGRSTVRLLVRAETDDHARERVNELLSYWRVDPRKTSDRIEVVRGDATHPRFGLSEERYCEIAETTTHIVHCAALVRMNLPLEEARRSAVGAALNVLDLAKASQSRGALEKVDFLSTVGVAGRREKPLTEDWVTEPRTYHNTYEQAKAEAEQVVANACMGGLPITVHRPSMVIGDSRTGKIIRFQIFYHLLEFLSGRRTGGLYPSFGEARLDLVPVDVVARAVCWSSRSRATVGRILHLCCGPRFAVPLGQLRDLVRERLRALAEPVPPAITIPTALLRAVVPLLRTMLTGRRRNSLNALPVFLDYLSGRQSFDNSATVDLLNAHDIHIPEPDAYLDKVLAFYLDHRSKHA